MIGRATPGCSSSTPSRSSRPLLPAGGRRDRRRHGPAQARDVPRPRASTSACWPTRAAPPHAREPAGNALKYSQGDSAVELRATREDGELRFEVSDHGIGISDRRSKAPVRELPRGKTSAGSRARGWGWRSCAARRSCTGAASRSAASSVWARHLRCASLRKDRGMNRILVIEDDATVRSNVLDLLEAEGFAASPPRAASRAWSSPCSSCPTW